MKPILVTRAALRSLGAAVIANETCIAINPFDLPNDELFADDEQTIDMALAMATEAIWQADALDQIPRDYLYRSMVEDYHVRRNVEIITGGHQTSLKIASVDRYDD